MNCVTSGLKIFFCTTCLTILLSSIIRAELRTVTTLEDTNDAVCDAHCSLREAIATANSEDTIIFARQLRGGTINLQSTLVIDKSLTIDGPNRRRITLRGNGTFGILRILYGNTFSNVFIDGLIIRDGAAEFGGGE
jgi:CSLREA domain-containing protein